MTDFNFLRIKWPKLAAIAADAGRLVEVSPSSAISTMQNFCEWAADIALDFYDINTQNGITQQEKLDTLKATGHVPADILTRFRDTMLAGGRHLYRANEDVEEARRCLDDIYEIGRWLNKEADRAGWPPKNDYYRPVMSSMGIPAEGGGGSFAATRAGKAFSQYKPLIIMVAGTLVVIVALIWAISAFFKSKDTNADPPPELTQTMPDTSAPPTGTADAGPTATPEPETAVFLDTLTPKTTKESFFLKKWKFSSGEHNFTIGDKEYQNGIGMFIPKKSITQTQGTWSMSFELDDDYDKLVFDLGVDAKIQYGEGYGSFRIQIFCDDTDNTPVYDSKLKDYKFTDLVREVGIKGCKTLIIRLTEKKGTKGTINVVLGDIRLVKGGEPVASAEPTGTATGTDGASASATGTGSASPTSTGTGSATGSAAATATATKTPKPSASATADNQEQEPPPG